MLDNILRKKEILFWCVENDGVKFIRLCGLEFFLKKGCLSRDLKDKEELVGEELVFAWF